MGRAVYSIRLYHPSPLRPSFCISEARGFTSCHPSPSSTPLFMKPTHTLLVRNKNKNKNNNNNKRAKPEISVSDAEIRQASISTDRRGCMTDVVIYQMRGAGGARVLKVCVPFSNPASAFHPAPLCCHYVFGSLALRESLLPRAP